MIHAVSRAIADFPKFTRLWLWLYIGRLAMALVITLPVLAYLAPSLDRSLYAQLLVGEWSVDVLSEIILNNPGLTTFLLLLLLFLALAALLLKQFLNGGIYRSIVARHTLPKADFFSASATDFPGHLRITLIMLPIYIALGVIGTIITAAFPRSLFGPQGVGGLLSLFAGESILWICLILGSVFSEFLRLSLAYSPGRTVAEYWKNGVGHLRKVGVQAIGAYAAFYVPFVLLWIVVEILAVQITGVLHNGLGVIVELLLFQFCAFSRTGQSLLGSTALAALCEPIPNQPQPQISEAA